MNTRIVLVSGLIAFIALAACAPAATPAATSAPKIKVHAAYSMISANATVIYVANDLGFFDKNGLDMELFFVDGGTRHAQAMLSGEDQIGFSAAGPIISAAAGGGDLVLLAGVVNSIFYDIVAVPSIKSGADLKGKTVAVSGASGSSATGMRIALRQFFNLDPDKDVTTISIGNEAAREAALLSGQIQATILNPDITVQAKKEGLVVLESLWNKGIPYAHTGVAASRDFVKKNPDIVTRYLKAIIQASSFVRDPANKDAVEKTMGKYLKTEDKDYLDAGYERVAKSVYQCAPYVPVEGVKTVIAETKAAADKGMKPEDVVDSSFIKALDDSGWIKANCK